MAHGIRSTASRLARLFGGKIDRGAIKAMPALVLSLANTQQLRISIGPVLLDRMVDVIAARLASELHFVPQSRAPGQTALSGMLVDCAIADMTELTARLDAICRRAIDLGEIRLRPVIDAVIVTTHESNVQPAALYAYGRGALLACSPLSTAGQTRLVEYAKASGSSADQGALAFSPDQIRVLFQPQICSDTGAVVALSVLPRIDHPQLGQLSLSDYQARLNDEMRGHSTRMVLRLALTALRGWDRMGKDVPFVSLTLSDRDLADPMTAEAILWELDRLELQPNRIEIELSEPIGHNGGRIPVTASLQRLKSAGCRLAMGEFGTGSAGLDDLRQIGVRRVRVGRSFVANCDSRPEQQRMILAIIALAEHLGLSTLSCGASTIEERAFLSQIGFDAVQGKAVAPAMTASGVDGFLASHNQRLPPIYDLRRRA